MINFCFEPLHINHNRKANYGRGPRRNIRDTSPSETQKFTSKGSYSLTFRGGVFFPLCTLFLNQTDGKF